MSPPLTLSDFNTPCLRNTCPLQPSPMLRSGLIASRELLRSRLVALPRLCPHLSHLLGRPWCHPPLSVFSPPSGGPAKFFICRPEVVVTRRRPFRCKRCFFIYRSYESMWPGPFRPRRAPLTEILFAGCPPPLFLADRAFDLLLLYLGRCSSFIYIRSHLDWTCRWQGFFVLGSPLSVFSWRRMASGTLLPPPVIISSGRRDFF